jgi:hypothetical protein
MLTATVLERLALLCGLLLMGMGCRVSPWHYYSGGGGQGLVNPDTGDYVPSVRLQAPVSTALEPIPAHVAVAELGERAPPTRVLDVIRSHRKLFSKASSLAGDTAPGPVYSQPAGVAVEASISKARAAGAQYVLLLSAQAHTSTPEAVQGIPLERQTSKLFRLSQWTEGKSTAVLVDVRDGTVLYKGMTSGLRKDPTVLPGTEQWFWGRPTTLLARSLMVKVTKDCLRELSRR